MNNKVIFKFKINTLNVFNFVINLFSLIIKFF